MKLNSKSGATLAVAAATLFIAGAVVYDRLDDRERRHGQVHGRQRLQGPERLQGRRQFLQGPECLQGGTGFSTDPREAVQRDWAASSSRADRIDDRRGRPGSLHRAAHHTGAQ